MSIPATEKQNVCEGLLLKGISTPLVSAGFSKWAPSERDKCPLKWMASWCLRWDYISKYKKGIEVSGLLIQNEQGDTLPREAPC